MDGKVANRRVGGNVRCGSNSEVQLADADFRFSQKADIHQRLDDFREHGVIGHFIDGTAPLA